MKTITILADGAGAFRCAAVNNPEIFRRSASEETGSAVTLFSISPLMGESAGALLEALATRVLPRFVAGPQLQHSPRFVFAVTICLVLTPLARQARRMLRRRFRQMSGPRKVRVLLRQLAGFDNAV